MNRAGNDARRRSTPRRLRVRHKIASGLTRPTGITLDDKNILWVSDTVLSRLYAYKIENEKLFIIVNFTLLATNVIFTV